MLSRNVSLGRPLQMSAWRKIALGTWRTAGDPSVYSFVDMDVERALAFVEKEKQASGTKITLTHFCGLAMAEVLRRHPSINVIARFGRLYPRTDVDVFFQVAGDSAGKDLSGMTVRRCDQKRLPEIAREMQERVELIRHQGDPAFKKSKQLMGGLPGFLVKPLLDLTSFILYTLNLWSPLLGSPKDPFGSIMVTSLGSLGIDMAFAPLVPYSRVPLLLALGAVKPTPVVRDGKLAIATVARLCFTFDHRLIDGVHAAHMVKTLHKIFAEPEQELSPGRERS
jgi:pyruvate/2-oxoglutarate dehydrogenase complex dihydrolipoamide acyltransferase (E2) component